MKCRESVSREKRPRSQNPTRYKDVKKGGDDCTGGEGSDLGLRTHERECFSVQRHPLLTEDQNGLLSDLELPVPRNFFKFSFCIKEPPIHVKWYRPGTG